MTSGTSNAPKIRSAGVCDTTNTWRHAVIDCTCDTYPGNLGPCCKFLTSSRHGMCVFCDHDFACHEKVQHNVTTALQESTGTIGEAV